MKNLFENLPTRLNEEQVDILAKNQAIRIERIISTGQKSPPGFWYDQCEHEWVAVLKGQAEVVFEDGTRHTLNPGDHLLIPARQKHRVEWTRSGEPTVWLAVFYSETPS